MEQKNNQQDENPLSKSVQPEKQNNQPNIFSQSSIYSSLYLQSYSNGILKTAQEGLMHKNKELTEEIVTLKKQIYNKTGTIDDLQRKIIELSNALETTNKHGHKYEEENGTLKTMLQELNFQLKSSEYVHQKLYEEYKKQLIQNNTQQIIIKELEEKLKSLMDLQNQQQQVQQQQAPIQQQQAQQQQGESLTIKIDFYEKIIDHYVVNIPIDYYLCQSMMQIDSKILKLILSNSSNIDVIKVIQRKLKDNITKVTIINEPGHLLFDLSKQDIEKIKNYKPQQQQYQQAPQIYPLMNLQIQQNPMNLQIQPQELEIEQQQQQQQQNDMGGDLLKTLNPYGGNLLSLIAGSMWQDATNTLKIIFDKESPIIKKNPDLKKYLNKNGELPSNLQYFLIKETLKNIAANEQQQMQ